MNLIEIANSKKLSTIIDRTSQGANYLTKIIRSHHTIELMLKCLLTEVLEIESFSEYERLNFIARAELAIALKIVRKDSLPILKAINKIRNKFAHNPFTRFSNNDATNLRSVLSQYQARMLRVAFPQEASTQIPKKVLQHAIFCLCIEMGGAARRIVKQKISSEITNKDVADVLRTISFDHRKTTMQKHEIEVEAAFEKQLNEVDI